jgi:hypothetical protein
MKEMAVLCLDPETRERIEQVLGRTQVSASTTRRAPLDVREVVARRRGRMMDSHA